MAAPLRVCAFQTVVEAGADLGILGGNAGFLLDKAGKDDDIIQRDALAGKLGCQLRGLAGKLCIQGVNIIVDVLVRKDVVGVRVEVTLALHQAPVVRDVVPEIVLAEIRAIGAVGAV